jgi:hypothetical protein
MGTGSNALSQFLESNAGLGVNKGKAPTPSLPRAAINIQSQLVFAATGVPQALPVIHVPADCIVYIRAHNGTTGNAQNCRIAMSREELIAGNAMGSTLTPNTEVPFPVDHLGQIWAVGTAGDGIIARINASSQQ